MTKYILRSTDFKYGTLHCNEQVELHGAKPLIIGLQRLGLCLVGAACSLPFPGFHFALVPGFIIFGLFQFFQAIKFKAKLIGVECVCPNCQNKIPFKVLYVTDEKNIFCKNCRTQLRILPASADSGAPKSP